MKCQFLHLGQCHHHGPYFLNQTQIEQTSPYKDLGILFDDHLKSHDNVSTVSAKANHALGINGKSFEFLDTEMVVKLVKTLVRPILEYGNSI